MRESSRRRGIPTVGPSKGLLPNEGARFAISLAVIGDAPHWIGLDGEPCAYEPYVREMRIWADLFREVRICSPAGDLQLHKRLAVAPYSRRNVYWDPVEYSVTEGPRGAARRLLQIPGIYASARRAIRESDFVLLRSPGHLDLVGAALVRWMRVPSITKWAGDSHSHAGEGFPNRIDRWLQGIPNDLHPVLVYGPVEKRHHVSFIPAFMSGEELAHARQISRRKRWSPPWRFLSVGRLEPGKGVDLALRGLGELKRRRPEWDWLYVVVGDGSTRRTLEALAGDCGIQDRVEFVGKLPFRDVGDRYAESHVVIMPSTNEGWPKVIAEGWAHGAVPVAAPARLVDSILRQKASGLVFDPTPEALATALAFLLEDPARMKTISDSLYERAQDISLDQFKARLERVLSERCGLK